MPNTDEGDDSSDNEPPNRLLFASVLSGDGSDGRGARRREGRSHGRHDRDDGSDGECDEDGRWGEHHTEFGNRCTDLVEDGSKYERDDYARADTDQRRKQADDHRLGQNRTADLAWRCPDGSEKTEFSGALTGGDGKGVSDDEDRHEQRDKGKAQQDAADDVEHLAELGLGFGNELLLILHDDSWKFALVQDRVDLGDDVWNGHRPVGSDHDRVKAITEEHVVANRVGLERHKGGAFDKPVEGERANELGLTLTRRGDERVRVAYDETVTLKARRVDDPLVEVGRCSSVDNFGRS